MRKYNHLTLSIQGVNLKRLIKTLYKNKIDIYDLNFVNYKNVELTLNYKDYKKAKVFLKDYRAKIQSRFGFCNVFHYFLLHIGLIVGIFIFVALNFLNNNYLSKIYITGNSRISNAQIVNFLGQKNIKTNSFFSKINTEEIENSLENNFSDISLVSVIKKGTNLIINIKEKLFVEDIVSSGDIYSSVDGQIVELEIIQGTTKFKVGDSVKKGDTIVAGYVYNGENKVDCKALAKIKLKVWYSYSYNFYNEETTLKRTGKVINNTYYQIYNAKIPMKVKKINFQKYEKETKTSYIFNNLILPIKLYSEKFYEIKENLIKNDFSLQKDAIIDKTIKEAKKLVPKNTEIKNVSTEIQDTDFGKIVTSFVETLFEIN